MQIEPALLVVLERVLGSPGILLHVARKSVIAVCPAVVRADPAKLQLAVFGWTDGRLEEAGKRVESRAAHDIAVTVLVVLIVAIDEVADDVDGVIEAVGARRAGGPAFAVGLVAQRARQRPGLFRLQEVAGVLGLEHHDAADGAGAIGVGHRTADDLDLLDQLGIEDEEVLGAVRGLVEILPRTVDDHRNAAEILQTADIDAGRDTLGVALSRDAGKAKEDILGCRRLAPFESLSADDAHRRHLVDGRIANAADDGNAVEQGHRRGVDRRHLHGLAGCGVPFNDDRLFRRRFSFLCPACVRAQTDRHSSSAKQNRHIATNQPHVPTPMPKFRCWLAWRSLAFSYPPERFKC